MTSFEQRVAQAVARRRMQRDIDARRADAAPTATPLVKVGVPEPLGFAFAPRPERGPSVREYYAKKHARGERGTYWLHDTGGRR